MKKPKKTKTFEVLPDDDQLSETHLERHPDYLGRTVSETFDGTLGPDGEAEHAADRGVDSDDPQFNILRPAPWGPVPIKLCSPVSGRYKLKPLVFTIPNRPPLIPIGTPVPIGLPRPTGFDAADANNMRVIPLNNISITVRVDVDRFFPQHRISVELVRKFPFHREHIVAEVTSDKCTGLNNRVISADIVYRDGNASFITGNKIIFRASRGSGFAYQNYSLEVNVGLATQRTYKLQFESQKFDKVEFEVDCVSNAGAVHTVYNTHDHPNKPADLPAENLSLARVFERAGFDVSMSPNGTNIPTTGAGTNGTWSNSEMHNAMVTYWSRFANNPNWAMWVLYAAKHDMGHGLGGIMFDDIGGNHRQGTAIFTDSFIKDVPSGDADPAGWRRRMQFWTAVHEMGHGFNLAHSWQKSLSISPQTGPWIPLANEPLARSFMNYPFNVPGGEQSFFSDFRFRFSDDELVFMRHAPRRFVQMGNSNWFENHGFEKPEDLSELDQWGLEIRPNRKSNTYSFLEPVNLELKMTNISSKAMEIDHDILEDGKHITIFVQRESGKTKQWQPMVTKCHEPHADKVKPGESVYGSHLVSCSTAGWTIDEPGFYKIQAAINMGTEIIVSNVLRIFVAPPQSSAESALACDYFSEDVGRAITFKGAPELDTAHNVLKEVIDRVPDNPAAVHAMIAETSIKLDDYKVLVMGDSRDDMKIHGIANDAVNAATQQAEALFGNVDKVADTLGHIALFDQARKLTSVLSDSDADAQASSVLETTIGAMKHRDILDTVIKRAETRLKRISKK